MLAVPAQHACSVYNTSTNRKGALPVCEEVGPD
jgi:hypothetical protein